MPDELPDHPEPARTAPSAHQDPPVMPVQLDPGATLPGRAHPDDAGLDLVSGEAVRIAPGGRALVGTGVRLALPPGTVGLVCPRSGLAVRHGVTVLNGPGIVDAGYRGEIRVPLHNTDPHTEFVIEPGDRIAQLVVVPFLAPVLRTVSALDATQRSDGGFGSSGGFGGASTTAVEDPHPTRGEV